MGLYYVTFRSVTHAQRGERIFSGQQIRCNIQRTPRWMEEQGCGYCLKLWTEDISRAVGLLQKNRVPLRKVYLQTEDGQLKEMSL